MYIHSLSNCRCVLVISNRMNWLTQFLLFVNVGSINVLGDV